MRRRQRRAPNTAQACLFPNPTGPEEGAAQPVTNSGEADFLSDAPHTYFGNERLDAYLERLGQRWTVRLREELQHLDYTPFNREYSGRGRRPYPPRMLIGLIVYGILCGRSSLRQLETLARIDLGAMWVCGGLQPDHSTIGDFIARFDEFLGKQFNTETLKRLVRRSGIKAGTVAGDGTVIESAASRWGMLRTEALREAADKASREAAQAPQDQSLQAQADKLEQAREVAEARAAKRARKGLAADETMVTPHDPDAVYQPRKDKVNRPSFKPSMLVHESGLIVGQALDPSSETAVLEEMLDQHREVFGVEPTRGLFDAGYNGIANIAMMCERGIDVLCPSGQTFGADWTKSDCLSEDSKYGRRSFSYDEENDVYRCPTGKELRRDHTTKDSEGRSYTVYRARASLCDGCALRTKCTTSTNGRTLRRYAGEEYREAADAVLRQPAARAAYRQRMPLAERPNAELRERLKLTRFHRVGLAAVRAEFALHVLALNLKWAVWHGGPLGSGTSNANFVLCALFIRLSEPRERRSAPIVAILAQLRQIPPFGTESQKFEISNGSRQIPNRITTVPLVPRGEG